MSKISFESSFAQKCYIITYLNFFFGAFWSVLVRTRKPALSLSCIFWLGHFLMSKISFESSFAQKCYIITVLIFFFGAFWSVLVRTRKPALSLSCVFWLGHFLRSKISFESSFLIKCYIITILNFFSGAFRSEPESLHFHYHAFSVWGTSWGQKSVLKAVF